MATLDALKLFQDSESYVKSLSPQKLPTTRAFREYRTPASTNLRKIILDARIGVLLLKLQIQHLKADMNFMSIRHYRRFRDRLKFSYVRWAIFYVVMDLIIQHVWKIANFIVFDLFMYG